MTLQSEIASAFRDRAWSLTWQRAYRLRWGLIDPDQVPGTDRYRRLVAALARRMRAQDRRRLRHWRAGRPVEPC